MRKWVNLSKNIIFFVLLIVVFFVWYPYIQNDFLMGWDDNEQVFNSDVAFLNWHNLKAIFSSLYVGMYQPLSSTVYALINTFFDHSSQAFHSFSVLLHLCNVWLVFFLLKNLRVSQNWRWVITILFAIHPVQQEVIAWASATSTLIFSCFYLLAMIFYIRFLKEDKRRYYWLCLLFFLLSCFSKVNAITLPIALIGLDYFFEKKYWSWRWLKEKLPFLVLSVIFGIIVLLARKENIPIYAVASYHPVWIVPYQLIFPLIEWLIPTSLIYYYELPFDFPLIEVIISWAILLSVSIIIFYKLYKKTLHKTILFGLLLYTINIILVSSIFEFSAQLTALRYTYIPILGILLMFSTIKTTLNKWLLWAITSPTLIILCYMTVNDAPHWKDTLSATMYLHKVTPNVPSSKLRMAQVYKERQQFDLALEYLKKANIHSDNLYLLKRFIPLEVEIYVMKNRCDKVLEIADSLTDSFVENVSAIPVHMSTCYINLKKYRKALKTINIAIPLLEKEGTEDFDDSLILKKLTMYQSALLSEENFRNKKYTKALGFAQTFLKQAKTVNDKPNIRYAYILNLNSNLVMNKNKEALIYANKLLYYDLNESIGQKMQISKTAYIKSHLFQKLGRLDSTLTALHQAKVATLKYENNPQKAVEYQKIIDAIQSK